MLKRVIIGTLVLVTTVCARIADAQCNSAELAKVLRTTVNLETAFDLDLALSRVLEFDWERLNKQAQEDKAGGGVSIAGLLTGGGNKSKSMTREEWERLHQRFMETKQITVTDRMRLTETFLPEMHAKLVQACIDAEMGPDQQYWARWKVVENNAVAIARIVYRPLAGSPDEIELTEARVVGGELLEDGWRGRTIQRDGTLFISVRRGECPPQSRGFGEAQLSLSFKSPAPPMRTLTIPSSCTPVMGSCCLVTGCIITTRSDCNARGGTYMGDDTECSPCMCVDCVKDIIIVAQVPREARAGSDSSQKITIFYTRSDGKLGANEITWRGPLENDPGQKRGNPNTLSQGSTNTIMITLDEAVPVNRITSIRWTNLMSTGKAEDSLKLSGLTVNAITSRRTQVPLLNREFIPGWLDDERKPVPMDKTGMNGPSLTVDIPLQNR